MMVYKGSIVDIVVSRFCDACECDRHIWCETCKVHEVLNVIDGVPDDTPTVASNPPTAIWLNAVDNDQPMWECSNCGARTLVPHYCYSNPNKYCYKCGARMEGTEQVSMEDLFNVVLGGYEPDTFGKFKGR